MLVLQRALGWKHTIKTFQWDLLLKSHLSNPPKIKNFSFIVRQYRRLEQSRFFFRFFLNIFLRIPAFRFFCTPLKTQQIQRHFVTRPTKRSFFYSFYTFRIKNWESFLFSYAVFFVFLSKDLFVYNYTKKRGNGFCALTLYNFNSYKQMSIHDFPFDADWNVSAYIRLYYNSPYPNYFQLNYQFLSLFKIFVLKDSRYI